MPRYIKFFKEETFGFKRDRKSNINKDKDIFLVHKITNNTYINTVCSVSMRQR